MIEQNETPDTAEELRHQVEELERLNQARSTFVSIAAHELRTPLTAILGLSEMLLEEEYTVEEKKEFAAGINRSAKRLNAMISELLELDRLESGRAPLRVEQVDLNAILKDAAHTAGAGAPQCQITLQLDDSIPFLSGDREQLARVASNLLGYAVDHSPDGREIIVASGTEADAVHVSIRSHGSDIPAEVVEQVFQRMSIGYGLPIARQIVRMHHGEVWAESVEGEGSTLHFTIPLPEAGGPAATA